MEKDFLSTKKAKKVFLSLKEVLEKFFEIENYVVISTKVSINDLVYERTRGIKTHRHFIEVKKFYGIDIFNNGKIYVFINEYDSVENANNGLSNSTLVAEIAIEPFKINSIIYLEEYSKDGYIKGNTTKLNGQKRK